MESDALSAFVFGDPDRLRQVLDNLLSNALRFSAPGEAVTVTLTPGPGTLRVSVADRGTGIPESFKPHVFERFTQAESGDSRSRGGTGLGLSICKGIVEAHEGSIHFESAPGQGTTFHVDLPSPPRLMVQRVLVCEDDPDIARLLTILLTDSGFEVEAAASLRQARKLLRDQDFDALTIDIALQDGDGLTLVQELRARGSSMMVVVVSAWAPGPKRIAGLGLVDWLQKPIDPGRLRDAFSGVRGLTVLHVEADADLAEVIRMHLEPGYHVVRARSLAAARRELAAGGVDLVILALTLPDGPGDELLLELSDIPVVVFSNEVASPAIQRLVGASLVKSQHSEADLVGAIKRLAPPQGPAG